MNSASIKAVVMAAGKGTRLKSELPKVLHPLFGKPLLQRVLESLTPLSIDECAVILGHGREQVLAAMGQFEVPYALRTVIQEPQLGTGHALQQVKAQCSDWQHAQGEVLILSGDVPLLRSETLTHLHQLHQSQQNDLTILTATLENPLGYGRVITQGKQVLKVVEQKDATPEEAQTQTINTGIYCLRWQTVAPLLDQLSNNNAQGEFYLTDVIELAVKAGAKVGYAHLQDPNEILGINSRADLALCHDVLNQRTLNRLMTEGVTILHPSSTFIGPEVQIGPDTTVLPGCYLQGSVTIGKRCTIGPHTTMSGTVNIGDDVKVMQSAVRDSVIGSDCNIGPFAQLRDGVDISHHVNIGNFVEVKKTRIDHHVNASHLAYLGDAELGSDVNIGAGTITANYDPIRDIKETTRIENGAKIGSNSVLVAPVTVGEGASVAAGSVITKNVAPWNLAIARGRQVEIEGWVKRIKALASQTVPN